MIDGLDLREMPRDAVRSSIIAVPQDPMLVATDTVRQNLNVADDDDDLPDEELVRALERVGVWDALAARGSMHGQDEPPSISDNGLDVTLSAPGDSPAAAVLDLTMESVPLSKGQEQLFSLARALLMRRSRGRLVLLDEATSSVDDGHEPPRAGCGP
ncbi:hypothetical protein NLG97_g10763 [Lecanicillium saksenae]|uniref:Uncharacterized protein n=1 Tax=Lecanicillium saksenae TaxID=468837 RepID=A0ACC1QF02_9HYPO|nr:hypothetical protein NLG97_g10763 [Lecanicillium saksenae]